MLSLSSISSRWLISRKTWRTTFSTHWRSRKICRMWKDRDERQSRSTIWEVKAN